MLRWLLRLLLVGLILAAIAFVVSRLMGKEEDFDDFDDLDEGFDFQETPVEIDVPADGASGGGTGAATTDLSAGGTDGSTDGGSDDGADPGTGTRLTEINGIGPAYEARLQALGIATFDDLLNADAANLAEQLGVIGGQSAVEDWIAQARQLVADGSQGADGSA